MIIRDFKKEDKEEVEEIFKMYWTDQKFLLSLSIKLLNKLDEFRFTVAEESDEIVGVSSFRSATKFLRDYAKTNNPAELYIIASKYKGKGIGRLLESKISKEAKKLSFTEIILYNPNSHKESWNFYENVGYERVGEAVAPDGEPGMIWRKIL